MDFFEKFGEKFDSFQSSKVKKSKNRVLVKLQKYIKGNWSQGIVISSKGKNYVVEFNENGQRKLTECMLSGTVEVKHQHRTLITVGDIVFFVAPQLGTDGKEFGRILYVADRVSFLMRKSILGNHEDIIASNMQQVMIMFSAMHPQYNLRMLDRILVAVEYGNLETIICINKIDLVDLNLLKKDFQIYEDLGYKVLYISAKEGIALNAVEESLGGKSTLLTGVSGVGKSTLINKLLGMDIQKVDDITRSRRGKHTTTSSRLFHKGEDTIIVDSPGFREFEVWGVPKEELQFYFRDFEPFFQKCKFQPCSHTHEPKCAVKSAVLRGKISHERYISYVSLFENL